MTWWVRDAALMLNVVAGSDPRDRFSWDSASTTLPLSDLDLRGLRVAWSRDLGYAASCRRSRRSLRMRRRTSRILARRWSRIIRSYRIRGRSSMSSGWRRWPARA